MAIQFNMKLAGLNISVDCRYDTTKSFCDDYLTDEKQFDIKAFTTDAQIEHETTLVENSTKNLAEQLCIYRSIANQLPDYSRFVFHGAAIDYKGSGILFTAPSGTGKTTHIRLWKRFFDKDVTVVNGDKPIVSLENGVTVYGTPWSGKENYHNNISSALKAICVISRGKENTVRRLSNDEAVKHLMQQIYLPKDPKVLAKTLGLLNDLIRTVPCYIAKVDISSAAASATRDAIFKDLR